MPQFSAVAVLISILFYCFITSVFFLGILYVVWRCCCRRFRSSSPSDVDEAAPGSTIVRVMQPQLGLEVSVIQTFPKFVYSADQEGSKGAVSECVVCLGTFEADEVLRQIPKCGHIFHAQCVDVWLQSHATCPYCRANLFPQQQPQQQLNDAQPHRDVRITVLDHTERASPITATYIV